MRLLQSQWWIVWTRKMNKNQLIKTVNNFIPLKKINLIMIVSDQEMLRVQQGLNERFLQDGRLRPMPILGGHLGLNGLPLGLPGMPTLTLRTEMHQHQHLHHHQHVVPAYNPPSNPMSVMQVGGTSLKPWFSINFSKFVFEFCIWQATWWDGDWRTPLKRLLVYADLSVSSKHWVQDFVILFFSI